MEWFWLFVFIGTPIALTIWICGASWNDLGNFLRWPEYLAERERRKRNRKHAINWPWAKKPTDEEVHPNMTEPDHDKRLGDV